MQLLILQDVCIYIISETLRLSIYITASRAIMRSYLQGNSVVIA
jgi:hypothetical protein